MAKMITRTILATKATVITVDTTAMTVGQTDFVIGGEWTDNNKLLKALKKLHENNNLVLSAVVKTEKIEKLYGMTEELFMAHAVELDPTTRKPLSAESTDTAVESTDTAVESTDTAVESTDTAKVEKITKNSKNK